MWRKWMKSKVKLQGHTIHLHHIYVLAANSDIQIIKRAKERVDINK